MATVLDTRTLWLLSPWEKPALTAVGVVSFLLLFIANELLSPKSKKVCLHKSTLFDCLPNQAHLVEPSTGSRDYLSPYSGARLSMELSLQGTYHHPGEIR